MDTSVSACDDFYKYSCGGWIKKNPIPPDQSGWEVYSKLEYDNQQLLWGLLQQASQPNSSRTVAEQKIGDFFHACMDEAAVERAGLQPLRPTLDRIAKISDLNGLAQFTTDEHLQGLGARWVFGFSADQDLENSEDVIAFAGRGRLGLPDRDYYFRTDKKSVENRAKYIEHLRIEFGLLGETAPDAAKHADQVMAIESELAKSMLTRVEMRNPHNLLHKMTPAQLGALTPTLEWNHLFTAFGLTSLKVINVEEPAFYKALEVQLHAHSVDEWRTFLRWNAVRDASPYLSSQFANANFNFYSKYLRGVPQMKARWLRCTEWTDRNLGEALGQVFVAKTFTPETKARTVAMTKEIEMAMEQDLSTLPWMSEATRKQALLKLHTIVNKIGYPDKWRDYSSVDIKRDDFFGDIDRAGRFEYKREIAKIGKPLDRTEWGMTPPTVNAYYNPQMNDINFPAGVLQPPLFDSKLDDAPNYGNTGATIGHELTHGFDDEGRQFDAKGDLKDWWTKEDSKEFESRVKCVEDQYAQYTVVDDIKINSKLTLGEDVADLGGTLLAYLAWKHATSGLDLKPADGFTPDQRFFIGMAQWACGDIRPDTKREHALTDPHSPAEFRINGVVSTCRNSLRRSGAKCPRRWFR